MKKHLLLFSALFLLTGCATVYLPESESLLDLKYSPAGDCVDKAHSGHTALILAGEQSRIVCGFVGTSGMFQAHCWIEVHNQQDDSWHLIDLSHAGALDGWPVEMYRDYSAEAYWYGIPEVNEIRKNINPDWQRSSAASLAGLPLGRGPTNDIYKEMTGRWLNSSVAGKVSQTAEERSDNIFIR